MSLDGVAGEESISGGNAPNGPAAVRGVHPGDKRAMPVERIDHESRGRACVFPAVGPLRIRVDRERTWFFDIATASRTARRGNMEVALGRMIGVMGVDLRSRAVGCDHPCPHGGRRGDRHIRAETTLEVRA